MNKEKLKSIATSKVAVGAVSFLLGGLILGGASGIDITQERYDQLLSMEKQVLGNKKDSASPTGGKDGAAKEDVSQTKIFKAGETAYLVDSNGVKLMSLTINSAKLIADRNQFSDKEAKKVVEVEYTYENLGLDENLQLFDSNFKIYDSEGNALESYPAGAEKHPQDISKGKKCTAEMSFALNSESNDIEIEFYENMFGDKANAIYKVVAE